MTERSTRHATFVIERRYAASPARVFDAFADAETKSHWFGCSGSDKLDGEFNFRVGGHERNQSGSADGPVHAFHAIYHDIVPNERIVFAYDMQVDTRRISVSLTTIELTPVGAGTQLTLTEQGVFLDGHDDAGSRERGTREWLDGLDAELARGAATA